MDDPIVLTIVIKGILAFVLAVGAIMQLVMGYRLYHRDANNAGKSTLNYGKFKMSTASAGFSLMGTAVIWAWSSVVALPNIKKDKDNWQVASFTSKGTEVKASPLYTSMTGTEITPISPDALKGFFSEALSGQGKETKTFASINGKPAKVDFSSLTAVKTEAGGFVLTTKVMAGGSSAVLAFRPERKDGKLTFHPIGIVDASEFGTGAPGPMNQNWPRKAESTPSPGATPPAKPTLPSAPKAEPAPEPSRMDLKYRHDAAPVSPTDSTTPPMPSRSAPQLPAK